VLGLVFLAHTVPALLLSGIVTTVAITRMGLCARAIIWLACVAVLELAVGAPFLAPLIVEYKLRIVNLVPGAWVHPLLRMPPIRKWVIAINLPAIFALATIIGLRMRARIDRATVVIFATWAAICLVFLLRHAACSFAAQEGGVCGVFVIAVHHYYAYLQAAWASIIGYAVCLAWTNWEWIPRRLAQSAGCVLVVAAAAFFLFRSYDQGERAVALAEPQSLFDRDSYEWILAHTRPHALFATPIAEIDASPTNMGVQAATVIAAGRRMVAAPVQHANPYLGWTSRNALRLHYLAALQGGRNAQRILCEFYRDTDAREGAFFLIQGKLPAPVAGIETVFSDKISTIDRVEEASCGSLS
jgi:hypothetical protein